MRSRMNCSITSGDVYTWSRECLLKAKLVKDHGWLCTATVVVAIVLRAAARAVSISAECCERAAGPSDHAVMTALVDGLPQTQVELESRLNDVLVDLMPRRMRRRKWDVAIDLYLDPYYGQPQQSSDELCCGKPKQGTRRFHAYASACIVERGHRYTLVVTWVHRHETMATVLRRLISRIREIGLKIRCLLLDRGFFQLPVIALLQAENLPFLMPVKFSGKAPKKGRKFTGLRAFRRKPVGRYSHTIRRNGQQATFSICVNYRSYRHHKTGKPQKQKLLFAVWRVPGSPTEIRERYRKRFGIETSYRQARQGQICTCTRNPHLRLFFLVVAFLLRNIWIWIHQTRLATRSGNTLTLHLDRLRFRRMLAWLAHKIESLSACKITTCVTKPP
jgi:hypothetical protein